MTTNDAHPSPDAKGAVAEPVAYQQRQRRISDGVWSGWYPSTKEAFEERDRDPRYEVRALYPVPSVAQGVTDEMVEAAAAAIYALDPIEDQEADLDGRPLGPAYKVPWQKVIEYDEGWHNVVIAQARAALQAALSVPSEREGWTRQLSIPANAEFMAESDEDEFAIRWVGNKQMTSIYAWKSGKIMVSFASLPPPPAPHDGGRV